MNRCLAWFLLVLGVLCAAPVSAADAQSQEHSIIIGMGLDYPPYSQLGENDEPVGFNLEVIRALARTTGLDVEIDYRPWGEIRDDLENGSIDAICGMYYSEERDRLVDFSQPFTIVHHAAFARKGANDLESPQQLRGKKLIVIRGDILHDLVLEEGYCDTPILADDQTGAFKALASGRGDYALMAKLPGIYCARELGLDVGPVGLALWASQCCFAVKKGNRELLGRLREGLALLIQSGRLKEISDKWLGSLERETAVAGPTVRIGVLAKRGTDKCRLKWGLTVDYLNRAIDGYTFKLVPLDFEEIVPAVEEGKVEFILANPSFYITLETRYGANRIATLKNRVLGNVYTTYGGVTFTRADRDDIQDLADLWGKSFMGVDERAFNGWLSAWREFKERGIDPRSDFAELRFGGTHDAVVRAVRDGKVDAGAVRTDLLERMAAEGKIRLEDFHVLGHEQIDDKASCYFPFKHSTDLYPEWPFAQVAHVSDELAEKVAIALIQMPADSSAARAGHYAGWTIPHNYQPVHECLKELRVGPYKDFGKITFRDVLMQYWPWIVSAIALLAAMAVLLAWVLRLLRLRKKGEAALREAKERFDQLAKQSRTFTWEIDTNGLYTYVSHTVASVLGYGPEELTGKMHFYDLHPEEGRDTFKAAALEVFARKEPVRGLENQIETKAGEILWVVMNGIPHLNTDGTLRGYRGEYSDITERKRVEIEKDKLENQLRQAQKMEAVGRLAGGVAHDFNNMLGVILGHTELALLQADENHELYSDLKEIQNAAERSADIIKQLLAFARKQTILPKRLALNDTVESMLNILRRLIGEDIDLFWKPAAHLWPVKMDPSQIDQILANLCINARDAISGVGKLTIETGRKSFDVEYCKQHAGFTPGDFVMLAVSDNGCGMDKETLDNIFEPFFTTKDVNKGTGLGLATIYGICKQNNGFINVYSEPGQGTTFKIYLPRLIAEENTDEAVPEKKAAAGGTETILLVEDEPTILRMTRMMLEKKGYTVISAATPTEAVEKTTNHSGSIDLLMTDVVMPEMNGRDLAGQIAELYPGIRILFMSGYTANVIAHRGVLDDGVAFIQKPFSMADMTEKVRVVLDMASDKS